MIGYGTFRPVRDGSAGESVHDFDRAEQAVRESDFDVERPDPSEYADPERLA